MSNTSINLFYLITTEMDGNTEYERTVIQSWLHPHIMDVSKFLLLQT